MSAFLGGLPYDAINCFLADNGELIPYAQVNGAVLNILAVIHRHKPSGFSQGSAGYKHEIWIANDPANVAGVIAINIGRDTVKFANQVGGAVETFAVLKVIDNDQGMWHLGVG